MTRDLCGSAALETYAETRIVENTPGLSTLSGYAASPGVAVGRCTVLLSLEGVAAVEDGCILVVKTASPALAKLMQKLKGLIAEQGGPLAIVCNYAREYGVPAVVGVNDVLETLQDGDLVRVNGPEGTVDILA